MWITTEWDADHEKRASVEIICLLLELLEAQAYCLMCEAWVASTEGLNKQEAKARLDFTGQYGVSALPPDQRDDVVFLNAQHRNGSSYNSRYLVTQRRHGPNLLGPRVDIDDGLTGSEGLLVNLYARKVDTDLRILAEALAKVMLKKEMKQWP